MENNVRDRKPPELCQIMITEVKHIVTSIDDLRKEVRTWRKERLQNWAWLIPTALIAIDLLWRAFNRG